jgi:hypothetical protein
MGYYASYGDFYAVIFRVFTDYFASLQLFTDDRGSKRRLEQLRRLVVDHQAQQLPAITVQKALKAGNIRSKLTLLVAPSVKNLKSPFRRGFFIKAYT